MNKILLDGGLLILADESLEITVKGNSVLYIPNNKMNTNLRIILTDSSELEITDFNLEDKYTNIEVIQEYNSVFNYYHTFKINESYKLNYKAIINGDNNVNNINIQGITNGDVIIDVDGVINKNSKDNVINENIKILTINGIAKISPMLHVSALNCIVNHNTAISNVREDELFYLNSKGISNELAIKLIENGYLYGMFKNNKEFLKYIGGDTNE